MEIFEKNFAHVQPEKSTDDRKDLHNQIYHLKQVKIFFLFFLNKNFLLATLLI